MNLNRLMYHGVYNGILVNVQDKLFDTSIIPVHLYTKTSLLLNTGVNLIVNNLKISLISLPTTGDVNVLYDINP